MTPSVVLVTGVSRFLGAELATVFSREPGVERVLGVDTAPPPAVRGAERRFEFVRADIRNPIVASLIHATGVDTVIHTTVAATPGEAEGRAKDLNVTGTLQLLAACQAAPQVRRVVVGSTAAVYGGASARDPAFFVEEDTEPDSPPRSGYARDVLEVEAAVRAFGRRRPDVSVTVLRLANLVGPRVETPLRRYFELPVVPTVLGFDPRIQFVHEDDVIEVFRLAAARGRMSDRECRQWTVNVGGDGILLLSQAIRRAGRVPIPLPSPAVTALAQVARRVGVVDVLPDRTGLLTFGGVVDTTRLRREFGYEPRFSSGDAFDDFVRHQVSGLVDSRRVSTVESGLRGLLAAWSDG